MTTSQLISAANLHQLEAITFIEGPLLIIEGLSSGKTFIPLDRIVFLLSEKALTPEKNMVVTITDKAAQELSTRASKYLSVGEELQHLGYFETHQMWHQDRYEGIFHGC